MQNHKLVAFILSCLILFSQSAFTESQFFTIEQEKYLAENPHVYAYFSQAYTGMKKTPELIAKEYNLSPQVTQKYLKALADIGVIEIPKSDLSAPLPFLVKGVSTFSANGPLSNKFTEAMYKQHYEKSMQIIKGSLKDPSKESNMQLTSAGFWLTNSEYEQYQEDIKKLKEKYIEISKTNLNKKNAEIFRVSIMMNGIPNWEPELFNNIKQNF